MEARVEISGYCDERFARLREAFREAFETHGEVGAAVGVTLHGRTVVNLWGGYASRGDHTLWTEHTLVNVYSSSKGLAALCVQRLIDQHKLELDTPVASYWPEFAAHGKDVVLVRHLLGHRAGLPALRKRLPHSAVYDQAIMASALADETPFWEPGTQHGYHPQTFGFLLAELVRRVTGDTLGHFLRDEIAGPLGADVHVGLAAEHDARVAKVTRTLGERPPAGEADLATVFAREPESMTALAFNNPAPSPGAVATRAYRGAEIPGSNAHATAMGLARVYGALAAPDRAGARILSAEGIARCQDEQSYGQDAVLRTRTRFGCGFMLTQPEGGGYFSPNATSFGHPGMGGSIGFADPAAGLSFGYVMNRAGMNILVGERPRRLIDALYASL